MSQCSRATSRPNAAIARAPTEPTMASSLGAIASRARPMRSSFSASGRMPKTSGTAHACAQSSTRPSGVGEVSRLATNAPITCPWVTVATSRTGQARSTMPARSRRRQNSATTGSAPSAFSTLAGRSGPAAAIVVLLVVEASRDAPRSQATPAQQLRNASINPNPISPTPPHVRRTGLARKQGRCGRFRMRICAEVSA